MLLQAVGDGTIPPPGFTPPPWSSLSANWNALPALENTTVTLGPEIVTLGHDDDEREDDDPAFATDVKDHEFAWDNENPIRQVEVKQFRIEWRPVTNGQFYEFYKAYRDDMKLQLPASWLETDDKMMVRLYFVYVLCWESAHDTMHVGSHLVRPCTYESGSELAGCYFVRWHVCLCDRQRRKASD